MFGGLADRASASRSWSIFLLLTANFQSFRLALAVDPHGARRSSRASRSRCWSRGRRSTSSRSWARSWPSAWRSPTRSCWSPSPSAAASRECRSTQAAVEGAASRLRPILMTSCAMIAGMMPMALGLGEGGEQTAPLGRAVIGGLVAATLATLLVLPAVFALLQRDNDRASPRPSIRMIHKADTSRAMDNQPPHRLDNSRKHYEADSLHRLNSHSRRCWNVVRASDDRADDAGLCPRDHRAFLGGGPQQQNLRLRHRSESRHRRSRDQGSGACADRRPRTRYEPRRRESDGAIEAPTPPRRRRGGGASQAIARGFAKAARKLQGRRIASRGESQASGAALRRRRRDGAAARRMRKQSRSRQSESRNRRSENRVG